jgi:hypothetical protein
MNPYSIALLTACLLAAPRTLCAQDATAVPDTTELLTRARTATGELLQRTREVLLRHLAAGGPAEAVSACADTAQQLNARVGQLHSLSIKRVSAKWRNPADAPDPYESEILDTMNTLLRNGSLTEKTELYGLVRSGKQVLFRYMKPIVMQGMCLSCHGEPGKISSRVTGILSERYPDDRATGYSTGQLRGAVSVILEP